MSEPRSNEVINGWAPSWDSMVGDDPEQLKLWRDWGYFGIPFTDSQGQKIGPRFTKIFSLNSNICYQYNWESMLRFSDPGGMLGWLENELSELERVGG